jgi:polyisoprenoid-binding protein YceI
MNRYRIDPGRSLFTVQAFAAGLLSAFAHSPTFAVRDYGGEVRLGDTAESLELELTVNPASLDLQDRVSAADRRDIEARMQGEVLETPVYRTIAYRGGVAEAGTVGQGRYRLVIGGDLSLHGVTRPQRIDAELTVFGDGLRLGGASILRMSEYGIRPVTALGGTIKLKDELKLSFDLAALPETS